jgi:lysozyme family protein
MTKVNGTWKTVQEWSLPAIFWKCEMYNGEGNEQNDMPVTLPPWFRPKKLVEMF